MLQHYCQLIEYFQVSGLSKLVAFPSEYCFQVNRYQKITKKFWNISYLHKRLQNNQTFRISKISFWSVNRIFEKNRIELRLIEKHELKQAWMGFLNGDDREQILEPHPKFNLASNSTQFELKDFCLFIENKTNISSPLSRNLFWITKQY